MRILVTGAHGFIARAFLSAQGAKHQVTTLVRGDSPASLHGPWDAILHTAMRSRPHEYHRYPIQAMADNVGLTHELLLKAAEQGCGHFILLSSGSVYGIGQDPKSEEDPAPGDGSLYGASKAMAESLARAYADELPITVLRLYHPYGKGLPSWNLLALLRRTILAGEAITLGKGLTPLLSWLHLDDLLEIIVKCLTAGPAKGVRILNAAHPEPQLLGHTVKLMAEALQVEPRMDEAETPKPAQAANTNSLVDAFGFTPRISLAQGLTGLLANWEES
jgi:nucleoside-diphosphate-sugar epimerase